MRRQIVGLSLSLLLFPLAARAHEHSAEAFAGGSGESGSFLRGAHFWVDRPTRNKIGPTRWSLMVDVSTHAGDNRNELTVSLAGLRWSLRNAHNATVVPSLHVLPIGGQFTSIGTSGQKFGGVLVAGGGLDVLFHKQETLQIGVRAQAEYVRRYSNGTRNAGRGSLGLVVRFLHHH